MIEAVSVDMKSKSPHCNWKEHAFTRAELLALLGALALLALLVLPALANTRPRSARVMCANNLRQIGLAMHLWGSDHADRPPWEVPPAEGGTMRHSLAPNAWYHFAWISNELTSAQLLFCPSDTGQPARDFSGDPAGGYLHANFRGRATSYFLNHTFGSPEWDAGVYSGDRNVTFQSPAVGCPRFTSALSLPVPAGQSVQWTSGLHGYAGNVMGFDGNVVQVSSEGLRQRINSTWDADNGSTHVLSPR
jgi:hypothetical protein